MLLISWKDTHLVKGCVSFLYGTNIDLFALSHRIITFDLEMRLLCFILGKTGQLRLLQKWGGRFYYYLCTTTTSFRP